MQDASGMASHTGFHFEPPGVFTLVDCVRSARSRPPGLTRCLGASDDRWVLDYLVGSRGRAPLLCGTATSDLRERRVGTAHLYPPGTLYFERCDDAIWMTSLWMTFSADLTFLHALTSGRAGFASIIDGSREIGRRMDELVVATSGGSRSYCRSCAKAYEVLALLETCVATPDADNAYALATDGGDGTVAQRARAHLERHYRDPLDVPGVAKALGMSASKLAHRFRAETGETIITALRRIRLEQSIPLLLRGTPLKTIAEATGFGNAFYYSRVFRTAYGMPPSRWKSSRG